LSDLVVLDLLRRGVSGLEVCRRLRERSPVPVIRLTAKDAEADAVAGLLRKLERGSDPARLAETVRGVGYRITVGRAAAPEAEGFLSQLAL
jgi:DNA-binding response OmpR family regulator